MRVIVLVVALVLSTAAYGQSIDLDAEIVEVEPYEPRESDKRVMAPPRVVSPPRVVPQPPVVVVPVPQPEVIIDTRPYGTPRCGGRVMWSHCIPVEQYRPRVYVVPPRYRARRFYGDRYYRRRYRSHRRAWRGAERRRWRRAQRRHYRRPARRHHRRHHRRQHRRYRRHR